MRFVCLPEALTLAALLALEDLPVEFRDPMETDVQHAVAEGCLEDALSIIERIFSTAWQAHQREAAALARALQADVLWRLQRPEEALDQIRWALNSIELSVTQVARYNEAMIVYFEGVIHYALRSEEKVRQTFALTHALLERSERFWGFQHRSERVQACQNVSHWMSSLTSLLSQLPVDEFTVIAPLYELINQVVVLTGAYPIFPFHLNLPGEALRRHLPPTLIPLEIGPLSFLQLQPAMHYLVLKIPSDGYLLPESRGGDILLLQATSQAAPAEGVRLSEEQPFTRRSDGRVVFRPRRQPEGFVGIPQALIREQQEDI